MDVKQSLEVIAESVPNVIALVTIGSLVYIAGRTFYKVISNKSSRDSSNTDCPTNYQLPRRYKLP